MKAFMDWLNLSILAWLAERQHENLPMTRKEVLGLMYTAWQAGYEHAYKEAGDKLEATFDSVKESTNG